MDDFFDDVKQKGSQLWGDFKEFYHDNKHIINPLVASLISRIHPAAASIFDVASTAFGGKLQS